MRKCGVGTARNVDVDAETSADGDVRGGGVYAGDEDSRPGKHKLEDASAAVAEVVSAVIEVDAVVDEEAVVEEDADDEEERVALWRLLPKRKN